MCVYICLFADCEGQSSETHWRCNWSWDTSSCTRSYGDASVQIRTQRGAERMPVVSENWHAWQGNKMGAMCSWQYYDQIWWTCAFLAFTTVIKQKADKDQTGGSLFSLAMTSEYSYATWTNEMHTFQVNTLIQFSIFDVVCMFWTSRVHSQDGFKTCRRRQTLAHLIKILIWFMLHNYITMHGAKNKVGIFCWLFSSLENCVMCVNIELLKILK